MMLSSTATTNKNNNNKESEESITIEHSFGEFRKICNSYNDRQARFGDSQIWKAVAYSDSSADSWSH